MRHACRWMLTAAAVMFTASTPAWAAIRVVATIPDLASIAEEVGGERVRVSVLCEGTQDPHFFEVLPTHMGMAKRGDLLLKVGLDFEPWLAEVVLGSRNENLHIVDCSAGIEILDVPEEPLVWQPGDLHRQGNPHFWLDPANGVRIARTIAEALMVRDPSHKDHYRERLADFESRLAEKMAQWHAQMKPFLGAQVVFVHDEWAYFSRAFGIRTIAVVERKPGVGPAPGTVQKVVRLLKSRETQIIVTSAILDEKIPRKIAAESWAELVLLAQSVGAIEGAGNYFTLFDVNLNTLTSAFNRVR